ncbi:MAG: Grx4 family monothiol glutaredoxin [Solirubrobacteraceae bacterium]
MSAPTENPIRSAIEQAIAANDVILFMKGTPEAPRCGFSAKTVAVLEQLGTPFAAVDVLPDPRIRQELSGISNWPTVHPLFYKGELVGGCDIVVEMHETGELATELGLAPQAGEAPEAVTPEGPPLTIENRLT